MECIVKRNGQITLPRQLRESLHLKEGDRLLFELQDAGTYLIRPRTRPVQSLKGIVPYSGPPKSIEDMEQAIAENGGR